MPRPTIFFIPKLNLLSDPFALPNMPAAIDRILRALDSGERIVLYGDYDVDGVTSLTILSGLLHAYGANVECFLPMRIEEGYGLSAEGVARCVQTLRPAASHRGGLRHGQRAGDRVRSRSRAWT